MPEGLRRLRRSCRNLILRLRAERRWPSGLRAELHQAERAFGRGIQQRYGRPLQRETLHQAVVLPFAQLLELWRGGSAYQGGPQPCRGEVCPALLQFRGEQVVSDPLEADQGEPLQRLEGRWFWCGPISDHFGHMVGEFSGRILAASLDPRPGTLLFAARSGDPRNLAQLQAWQRSLLNHLNPGGKAIQLLQAPSQVDSLVVIPPQQRMLALPTAWQLAALEHCCRRWRGEPIEQVVVLSRARHAGCTEATNLLGSYAGEAALDAVLQGRGARVVYPETLSLEEQLRIIVNARCLVVSEGSALHGLELLGHQPHTQVLVVARRPPWPGMNLPLRARFPRLHWLDAVEELLWLPPANPRVKGLARLNLARLLDQLGNGLGWSFSTNERRQVQQAADRQIQALAKLLPLQRDADPPRQPPAGMAGW